jgi:hypothetical protein
MQHLQKTGGWGLDYGTWKHSLFALFCRSLHQECFTTLLLSKRSALFRKNTQEWDTPSPRFSLVMRHLRAKSAFANPLFSIRCTLFQVPYPATPLFPIHTKIAGYISTIPILVHAACPLQREPPSQRRLTSGQLWHSQSWLCSDTNHESLNTSHRFFSAGNAACR